MIIRPTEFWATWGNAMADDDPVVGSVTSGGTDPHDPANECFVCGPGNAAGLQVRFRLDGDVCRGEFTPRREHMGYDNVTHGGLLFSLLDDVMANWLYLQGERCFTARAEVRYRDKLPIGVPVTLEGRLETRKGRLAVLKGVVLRADTGAPVVEATGRFMVG